MLKRPAPLAAVAVLALAFAGCGVVDDLVGSPELSVRRFEADPSQTGSGAVVTLAWDVDGAETVEIDNGIGSVRERGNREVRPSASTRYTLTARKGSAQATAVVTVSVVGPAPAPSPVPTPTPLPTPTPAPTIGPGPSPTPSPAPTGDGPGQPVKCPGSVAAARTCAVGLALVRPLGEGQCLTLADAEVSLSCPAPFAATRDVALVLSTRGFASRQLSWRPAASSGNYAMPSGGPVAGEGRTRVEFKDVLLGNQTVLEILDGAAPIATVTVRSN